MNWTDIEDEGEEHQSQREMPNSYSYSKNGKFIFNWSILAVYGEARLRGRLRKGGVPKWLIVVGVDGGNQPHLSARWSSHVLSSDAYFETPARSFSDTPPADSVRSPLRLRKVFQAWRCHSRRHKSFRHHQDTSMTIRGGMTMQLIYLQGERHMVILPNQPRIQLAIIKCSNHCSGFISTDLCSSSSP